MPLHSTRICTRRTTDRSLLSSNRTAPGGVRSFRGLERRHRRGRIRRLLRGSSARAPDAGAEHAHHARQRRQLPALHAVPARGRRRHAGAAPRRHAAARRAEGDTSAPGRGDRPRRGAAHRHDARPGGWRARAGLRPAGGRASARCRGCCRSPASSDHAVGFKTLADAIWLRNHVIECLELADATDNAEAREELLSFVFVGGGYAGLEALAELQDFAAEAMKFYPRARLHGMRWVLLEATGRVLPEIDSELAERAMRDLRERGIDIRLGTTLEEVTADWARLSTGETIPTRTLVWTAGVVPHPEQQAARPAARRARADRGRQVHARAGRGLRLGDRRRRRRAGPGAPGQALPAHRPARDPAGQDGRAQRRRGARLRHPQALQLPLAGAVRQPRPLQGGRQGRPRQAPGLPRLVAGAHATT